VEKYFSGKDMQHVIGVFGSGTVAEADWQWQQAYQVGRRVAELGYVVLTGGMGGVMTAACQGAKDGGGQTIGVMPGNMESSCPNPYIDFAVFTGMGEARNVVNVKSCHAVVAVGGEYGTLSEIALALKRGCPVVLLNSWSFSVPGMEEHGNAYVVSSVDEAVEQLRKVLQD
jgi:uncharacterized protein (TIGR00725 family)